jgi:anion-transporting  ArsA/GET3 family ATPase
VPLDAAAAEQVLHELGVHQVELELQNEQLRNVHSALERSRDRYIDLFEHAPVGFEPRQVHPGVFAMQMDTESSLREYLKVQARVPVFGRIGPMARAFDFVATAAPGVKEILTVGKICWELRESLQGRADWDLIVVDAAATGHVISQLDAPEAIQELVAVGPIRNQTGWLVELLSDPALTALNVVTSPLRPHLMG